MTREDDRSELMVEPHDSFSSPARDQALLRIENLRVHFPVDKGIWGQRQVGSVRAVDGLTFQIRRGETLGLVGESGCGKSTTGQAILQLTRPTGGQVYLGNTDLTQLEAEPLRQVRRRLQIIFQNPFASLNPQMSVGDSVGEPIEIYQLAQGQEKVARVRQLLERVGLNPSFFHRYPHEFSGGQRQRIMIARALAVDPEFVVCDEPVAALDVSIQAQVINLLKDLQADRGLTYLFIAHDLSVVRHISDRIAVMYLGKIVELADRDDLYQTPWHPYTQALLSAVPIPDPRVERQREQLVLTGDLPSPADPPQGCRFHTRCPFVMEQCRQDPEPQFREVSPGHFVACHLV